MATLELGPSETKSREGLRTETSVLAYALGSIPPALSTTNLTPKSSSPRSTNRHSVGSSNIWPESITSSSACGLITGLGLEIFSDDQRAPAYLIAEPSTRKTENEIPLQERNLEVSIDSPELCFGKFPPEYYDIPRRTAFAHARSSTRPAPSQPARSVGGMPITPSRLAPTVLSPQSPPRGFGEPADLNNYEYAPMSQEARRASIEHAELGIDGHDIESISHCELARKYPRQRSPPLPTTLPVMGSISEDRLRGRDLVFPSGVHVVPTAELRNLTGIEKEEALRNAAIRRWSMELDEEQADPEDNSAPEEERFSTPPASTSPSALPVNPLTGVSFMSSRTSSRSLVGPEMVPQTVGAHVVSSLHTGTEAYSDSELNWDLASNEERTEPQASTNTAILDHSPAPLPPDAITAPTLDLRAHITKAPAWESGEDKGVHEGTNKVITFVATERDMSTGLVVDQNPGFLDPSTSPDAFKSTKPNKQRANARSQSPLFDTHWPFRQLRSRPIRKYSSILAGAVQYLAVSRIPEEHDQLDSAFHPELSDIRPSAARSRRQGYRITWVPALLHYHSFSWEPSGSSVHVDHGRAPSSSQTPGGIDSRLDGGGGIWSGQGPGLELSLLPALEQSLDWKSILELLGQAPDVFSSKPTHDPINSSIPQQPDYPPCPPIPLDLYSEGYSAGHSAGYSAGYSAGVAQVYAALEHYMKNTIRPLIDQKASSQDPGSSTYPNLAPLAAAEPLNTALTVVTTTNFESLPGTGPQTINLNPSGGLPQNLEAQITFDAEHQMSVLDDDPDSGPIPSDLGATLDPEVRSPAGFDYSFIPNGSSSTNDFEITPMPVPKTSPRLKQQRSASPEPAPTSGGSLGPEGTKAYKHPCETCGKVFRRPQLLKDHKRIHTGEPTGIYRCKFKGCTRVYTNYSNMKRHFKSHFQGDNSGSSRPTTDEQGTVDISEHSPVASPSTHNARTRTATHRSDRGAFVLGDVRFRPYETPDTVRHKVVQR